MKKLIYPMLSLIVFGTTACKKEDVQTPDPCESQECVDWEMPSKVGSYWIYEWFLVDSMGVETSLGFYDTVRIVKDTVISGSSFSVYEGTLFYTWHQFRRYQRDSSGYVIGGDGDVMYPLFPSGEEKIIGENPPFYITQHYSNDFASRTIPAGTFNCFSSNVVYKHLDGTPINLCGDLEYWQSEYFHPEIGLLAMQLSYVSDMQQCQYREGRLIEYHLEQ